MLWCKLYFFLGSKFKEGKLIQPVTRAWGIVLGLFSNEKGKSICFSNCQFYVTFFSSPIFQTLDPLYIPPFYFLFFLFFFFELAEFGKCVFLHNEHSLKSWSITYPHNTKFCCEDMFKDQGAQLCRDTRANTALESRAGWPCWCSSMSRLLYLLVLVFWTTSAWDITSSVKVLFSSSDELAFPLSCGKQCLQDLCEQNSAALQFDRMWKRIYSP